MIYLLYKIDFDTMENHLSDALSKEVVGYAEDEAEAKFFMDFYSKGCEKHMGWDGHEYPIFSYEAVKQL